MSAVTVRLGAALGGWWILVGGLGVEGLEVGIWVNLQRCLELSAITAHCCKHVLLACMVVTMDDDSGNDVAAGVRSATKTKVVAVVAILVTSCSPSEADQVNDGCCCCCCCCCCFC